MSVDFKKNETVVYGQTILIAQKNACKLLNVTEDQIDFEILELPRKKTLGIFGGKDAKIKAKLKLKSSDYASLLVKPIVKKLTDKDVSVKVIEKIEQTVINISGDGAADIVNMGKDVVDSIQYLTSFAISSKDGAYRKVKINVDGLEERRKELLKEKVENAIKRAKHTGKKVVLSPMNSYERLVTHQVTKTFKGATSYSEGEGKDRHIVIELASS